MDDEDWEEEVRGIKIRLIRAKLTKMSNFYRALNTDSRR